VRGAALGTPKLPTRLASSGHPDIDAKCLKEVESLNRVFDVRAAFGFYEDVEGKQGNALAYGYAFDKAYPDGTVLFGKRLAANVLRESTSFGLIGVMGHEWGHIRQFKEGLKVGWDVHYELSADYLSGWYLSHIAAATDANREAIMTVFQGLGDTDFTDADHHGTPSQRSKMFSFAYTLKGDGSTANLTAKEALDQSLSFFN